MAVEDTVTTLVSPPLKFFTMSGMQWGDYVTEEKLGKGCFGVVYKVYHIDSQDEMLAMKLVDKTDKTAKQEAVLLSKVSHRFIIKYHASFYCRDKMCIVMEFANRGTFERCVKDDVANNRSRLFEEHNVWRFICHISSALAYLHSFKPEPILHRDLKPANLLGVTGWCEIEKDWRVSWKLSDFGIAKLLTREAQEMYYTDHAEGSPIYMPQEVLNDFTSYTFASDVWALAAVVSFLCNRGRHLFTREALIFGWPRGRTPLGEGYSEGLRNMVADMLSPDPSKRPSAKYVRDETGKFNRQAAVTG